MTELEWAICRKPNDMLLALPHTDLDRKYRLFACACARRVWHLLDDERPRRAVEVAELYADGAATESELNEAYTAAKDFASRERRGRVFFLPGDLTYKELLALQFATEAAQVTVHVAGQSRGTHADLGAFSSGVSASAAAVTVLSRAARAGRPGPDGDEQEWQTRAAEEAEQAVLIRDVFADPFRARPAVDRAWLSWNDGILRHLARSAYEDRELPAGRLRPERLGLVADALEDAGCADVAMLGHLRSPGLHVRGCWPLDLVLGTA
jgi:hypothetical protein